MNKIYKIARTELQTLFYSPVAWLILVIFAVQAGMAFTGNLDNLFRMLSLGNELRGLTGWVMNFRSVQEYLYLYIPLLTMGLMSRELSSGSVKLLYSSPVTNVQIILGKYLAMMIYGLMLIGILVALDLLAVVTVARIEIPLVLTCLLGLYLLICVYAAIGLFMSCLTAYQVVAAMGTLALFAVLNSIGNYWQDIGFVRDLTFWLSIAGRAEETLYGLIVSENMLYFVIVILLFLSLSILKLQSDREKRSRWVNAGRFAAAILIAVVLGYITSRPSLKGYYDVTRTKYNTLTPNSQDIVKRAKGGLTVTTYVNLFDRDRYIGLPAAVNYDRRTLEDYIRFKPEIKIKYVYYYHKIPAGINPNEEFPELPDERRARKICDVMGLDISLFKTPKEIDGMIDLSAEQYRFVRLLQRDSGQKTFLRMFDDMMHYPDESEVSAAMKRLVMKLPTVGFLQGNGERDPDNTGDRGYNLLTKSPNFRNALINQGFAVKNFSLAGNGQIPADVNVVVVAELRTALSDTERTKLEAWIAGGGNLVIAGEPGRQVLMNSLLSSLGVSLMPGRLVQPRKDFAPDLIVSAPTEAACNLSYLFKDVKKNGYGMVMPGCAGLSYDTGKGFTVTPMFVTPAEGSWNELETQNFLDDSPVLNPAAGEKEGSVPTVLALSRKMAAHEQRIVVLGDADCLDNAEMFGRRKNIKGDDYQLGTGLFYWLSYDEAPIDIRRPMLTDDKINMTRQSMAAVKLFYIWIWPGLLAITGILIWIRRKGR